jgi:hypothetical protein
LSNDLHAYIADLEVIDVHEHHIPEMLDNPDVGLLDILQQSYAGWTQNRPYPLPSESRGEDPMLAASGKSSWRDIARFVEDSGSSMFVRNLVESLTTLYDLSGGEITPDNWAALDAAIRRRHADPGWTGDVLDRAGVRHVITDAYTDPLLNAREAFGPRYSSVARINALAAGWHPGSRDHNGNSAHKIAERLGCKLYSFDDYLAMLEVLVDGMPARHQLAVKNALAYDREINFDDIDETLARAAWGNADPTPAQRKAFGDVVVDRLCRLAGERDIPVQMHLGSALIRGSHPMNVAGLVERHPRTRFLLMHLAYPWSADLFGLAFVYRNVWLDLTWAPLLSPSHFKRALHEAIEVLPNESRMMFGGDNWHIEETYGTITLFRRLIGEVLDEKVQSGYFPAEAAKRVARKILNENASAFFKIES